MKEILSISVDENENTDNGVDEFLKIPKNTRKR